VSTGDGVGSCWLLSEPVAGLLVVDQWGSVVVGIGCRNRHLPEMCIEIDTFRNRLLGIKVGFLTRVIGVLLVEKRKG